MRTLFFHKFWVVCLVTACVLISYAARAETTFRFNDRRYTIPYDNTRYDLVSPGMLSTDLIIRARQAEDSFYPNLTIKSQEPIPEQFRLEDSATAIMTYYQTALQEAVIVKHGAVEWKTFPAYLIDTRYRRESLDFYLRTLIVKTPRMVMTISLTSPYATREVNMQALMAMVNRIEVEP